MSKTNNNSHIDKSNPRNYVKKQMIEDRLGLAGGMPMRDRRDRRSKDARRSWKNEEY